MITLQQSEKGFTLIEMVISLGIFIVLLQVVAFSYTRFVTVERQHIGEQEMQEDTRLFLQLFNREARTAFGNTFQTIVAPAGVVFRNQDRECVRYAHEGTPGAGFVSRSQATAAAPDEDCADQSLYTASNTRRVTDITNTDVATLLFDATSAQPAYQRGATPVAQLTQQGFITVRLTVMSRVPEAIETQLQSSVTSHQTSPY